MLCKSIIVATQTEDQIAGLPNVDAITDMLKQKWEPLKEKINP